jgi:hypothetical protein
MKFSLVILGLFLVCVSAAGPSSAQSGEIKYFWYNPEGLVDGIVVSTTGDETPVVVKFGPQSWTSPYPVEVGDRIQYQGVEVRQAPNVVLHESMVQKEGRRIVDSSSNAVEPPALPPSPRQALDLAETGPQRVMGRIAAVGANPDGNIDAVILVDGSCLNFPPHVRRTGFDPNLKQWIEASGQGRKTSDHHKTLRVNTYSFGQGRLAE